MLLSLRATPVVCKAWIIDKGVCVYVGWGGCALESALLTQLKIARGTADLYKACTLHGRQTYKYSDAGHIPSPSLCKVTVKHTRDIINILLRYTKIKTLNKTPAMGGT